MAKVKVMYNPARTVKAWVFDCPACGFWHSFQVEHPDKSAPCWTFNGDVDKPTFSPSLLCRWPEEGAEKRCHSFVVNGEIRFCGDCSHDMAGKTVPLQDME